MTTAFHDIHPPIAGDVLIRYSYRVFQRAWAALTFCLAVSSVNGGLRSAIVTDVVNGGYVVVWLVADFLIFNLSHDVGCYHVLELVFALWQTV